MAYAKHLMAACAAAFLACGAAHAGGFDDKDKEHKDKAPAADRQHQQDRDHAHQVDREHQQDRDHAHQVDREHQLDRDHEHQADREHQLDRDRAHLADREHQLDHDRLREADRVHAVDRDRIHALEAGRHDPHWADNRGSWRTVHGGWDHDTRWRRDSGWWRRDPHFVGFGFTGVRVGFYFAPGFGYYQVPREYYGHAWRTGERVPNAFWRYTINDYAYYGLQPPPYGCAWIWLNGSVALVDMSDGYVIDVVDRVW